MRKYLFQPHILLLAFLALAALIYNLDFCKEAPASSKPPPSLQDTSPTPAPPPSEDVLTNPAVLTVRDTVLSIGDPAEDVIRKLGIPGRIAETEYEFQYYIYNNDYRRLLFVAVQRNKVAGFYTDAVDFQYHGLRYGASLDQVNYALAADYEMAEALDYDTPQYKVRILMDRLESGTVTGVYVLSSSLEEGNYNDEVLSQSEQMIYDLTNSVRVRNGLSPLSWSSSAGNAARKHSLNMASEDFFAHRDPSRRGPGDRLKSEGISYRTCGENIIAGYEGVILSVHGWYNSSGHRKNLLHTAFRYVGVGAAYDKESRYQFYITQNFYR